MNIKFSSENSFENFKTDLQNKLAKHVVRKISTDDYRKAAVLVLFINKDSNLHVVLTERSDKVSTHKGQISFPGGVYEEEDDSLLETALRETWEEIGIEMDEVDILGEFDEFFSVSCFHVHVFVGTAQHPLKYNPNIDEIGKIIEVPFSLFLNEKYKKKERHSHNDQDFNIYYYEHDNQTVWGMTARILTDLSRKVFKK